MAEPQNTTVAEPHSDNVAEPQRVKVEEPQSATVSEQHSDNVAEPQSAKITEPHGGSETQPLSHFASETPAYHSAAQPLGKESLLGGSISINVAPVKVERPQIQAEVKPLTQEDLERYWQEAGEGLELTEVLQNATVRLGEKPGLIEIDAQTTWFADEFRQHRIKVLEFLREKSGLKMLDCKVNPMFVGKDEVIYSPDQKYNVMLENNPRLSALRRLFPQIDY